MRSLWTHQQHALKEKKKLESKYDQMTHAIHERSLTFQFIANQARFLGDFLDNLIGELNDKEHWDMPIEPQDEGVLLEGIDLGTGEDQPHNTMMGSQNHNTFEFDVVTINCVVGQIKVGDRWCYGHLHHLTDYCYLRFIRAPHLTILPSARR